VVYTTLVLGGKMNVNQDKLVEVIQKLFNLGEEDRERVIRIVRKYHPRKILVALENTYKVSKYGKKKTIMSLDEFEEMLKRVRF